MEQLDTREVAEVLGISEETTKMRLHRARVFLRNALAGYVQRVQGEDHACTGVANNSFAMLSEYLDGQLPAKNCRELERHLRGCRPCIAYLESLQTTVEACRKFKAPRPPALSKQVKAALVAAVQRAREKR